MEECEGCEGCAKTRGCIYTLESKPSLLQKDELPTFGEEKEYTNIIIQLQGSVVMSTVGVVYGVILSSIFVSFTIGVTRYIHKWKEGVAKLNHIEEEASDFMLHHGK